MLCSLQSLKSTSRGCDLGALCALGALGCLGCLAGWDLTACLRSGISKPQRRKEARAEVLIIHSDHPCQHLATITPLVAELDEIECFFMGSLISPVLPPVSLQITWDVFIFRDLGFDESTAILFFVILKWLVGAVQVKLRLNNSVLYFVFFYVFAFVSVFVAVLGSGWGQERRS